MRLIPERRPVPLGHNSLPWVLLLAAVLVPAGCVLWFMNEAIAAQAASARQGVLDAYRGQLRAIRAGIAADWAARLSALDALSDTPTAADLEAARAASGADGMIAAGDRPPIVVGGTDIPADLVSAAGDTHFQGLRRTRLPDVWQLASSSGRVVALYDEDTVHLALHGIIDEHQSDVVRFAVFKPDEIAYDEAAAIGPVMPGWHASFTLLDTSILDAPARARVATYAWIGAAGIGFFAVLALTLGHSVRRQIQLTRLKTDLVAAVSHELRTPLASMRLLVDALLRDQELDPQKTREYLGLIAVENARLSRLIDNFLTFSRLERRRLHLTVTSIEPGAIVEAATAAMRERLHPGCDIHVEIAPGLPALHADADALVTALLNLLDNACKYTPEEKQISIRVTAEEGGVVFAVQDNGIGIPASEHTRIFRRFYRLDRRSSRGTSGVGLGLAIVDEIARAHGGSVCVRSEAGAGSTFIVRLPRASGLAA